ncbi:MAG TPA: glycosyltransferase family 4 protein [Niabella sp.]|nr:glycosyltransferase family 4 protein [Niabella sp.]
MNNIASIVPYKIIPAIKGGEKGIYYFLKYVARYTSVTCFTVSENTGKEEGIDFIDVLGSTGKKSRYADFSIFNKIKKACKTRGIKHVIIEHPYYAWLGIALKKLGGLKLIVHSHNIEAARFKSMNKWWWRIMFQYEKLAHRYADFNFFITEEDKAYAIKAYKLDAKKCDVITYGIEAGAVPPAQEKQYCRNAVCKELGLPADTRLILFNGTLDYGPNRNALDRILNEINPELLKASSFPYRIIICGLRLPERYDQLKAYKEQHIIYKGFVEDIDLYFKAADLFINPVTDGGGIKTKLVEALGANTPAVSFKAGAYGVPQTITGNHLTVIDDGDAVGFAVAICKKINSATGDIPESFYQYFSWDAIAQKAVGIVRRL